jgi:hypothetical protein
MRRHFQAIDVQGTPVKPVAEQSGLSRGNAGVRVFRARGSLEEARHGIPGPAPSTAASTAPAAPSTEFVVFFARQKRRRVHGAQASRPRMTDDDRLHAIDSVHADDCGARDHRQLMVFAARRSPQIAA